MPLGNIISALPGFPFIIFPGILLLLSAVIKEVWHWSACMCPHPDWCRMIRKHHHAEILSCLRKSLGDRPDNALIQALDRLYLLLNAALVSHLIRSFQMHVDKVISVLRQDI